MRILYNRFLTLAATAGRLAIIAVLLLFARCGVAQPITPGAAQMDRYLPQLQGKRVALLVNQTSVVGSSHLIDTLLRRKVNVIKIFAPEHGYRGTADAGAHVANEADESTGLPVISLYGNNKKPSNTDLSDVDLLIYDIQDVGVRFYTYISTLQYAMEACAANGVKLLLLDRPNPNGNQVDGPVLDTALRSFVGMQPIPVLYGMTPGEYAQMLVGEQWFPLAKKLSMSIIPCCHYTHDSFYHLPVAPSPNLQSDKAIAIYPSLCFFEGTVVSVGRGTDSPFEVWGAPAYKGLLPYSFTPRAKTGASSPMYKDKTCYGERIGAAATTVRFPFSLAPLLKAYKLYPEQDKFFNANSFFEKLAGTSELRTQIKKGMTEQQITASWQPKLSEFKKIRKKYLLYKD